jgi:hypothetical protein
MKRYIIFFAPECGVLDPLDIIIVLKIHVSIYLAGIFVYFQWDKKLSVNSQLSALELK